jgi:hypothetical protein
MTFTLAVAAVAAAAAVWAVPEKQDDLKKISLVATLHLVHLLPMEIQVLVEREAGQQTPTNKVIMAMVAQAYEIITVVLGEIRVIRHSLSFIREVCRLPSMMADLGALLPLLTSFF